MEIKSSTPHLAMEFTFNVIVIFTPTALRNKAHTAINTITRNKINITIGKT